MKQILLSLLLLSSIPLFSQDATANAVASSAAADVKTRAANVSSSAAAQPVEADVKRKAPEADVKSDAQSEYTYEQLMGALHPILFEKISQSFEQYNRVGRAMSIVVECLLPRHERYMTIQKRADDLYGELMNTIIKVAEPQPNGRHVIRSVQGVLAPYAEEHHDAKFPKELAWVVADYAQHDVRPLNEVFTEVMDSPTIKKIEAALKEFDADDEYATNSPRGKEYRELLATQGIIFPFQRVTVFSILGFDFHSGSYLDPERESDRLVCRGCGPELAFYPPANRQIYPNQNFGDVCGLALLWRNPWSYHENDCPWKTLLRNPDELEQKLKGKMPDDDLADFKQGVSELVEQFPEHAYGENVGSIIQNQVKFSWHFFLHMDLHARRLAEARALEDGGNPDSPENRWLRVMQELNYWMHLAPRKYAYIQDPQAWVEAQNKLAEAFLSPIRYKLPEKPATK